MTDKINLLDFDRQKLKDFLLELGEKPFRTQQILRWIYRYGCNDIDQMSDLGKPLRFKLKQLVQIRPPEIAYETCSVDGTQKWLLRLTDGNCIETVFIPEVRRGTLCISSQVGCIVNCGFCATAQQGFNRNLSVSEIIGQVWLANQQLIAQKKSIRISNVVFMGMGEPLLNFNHVITVLNLLQDDYVYGLSKRRITISTSGIVPQLKTLSTVSDVALAISLHASNDQIRNQIIPINKKYPIGVLLEACRHYFKSKRRSITVEYVLLDGMNDQPEHALELIQLLKDIRVKINLIPFNIFPGTCYRPSPRATIEAFQKRLLTAGFNTTIRKTRGADISAACGQLVGKVFDRSARNRQEKIL